MPVADVGCHGSCGRRHRLFDFLQLPLHIDQRIFVALDFFLVFSIPPTQLVAQLHDLCL